MTEDTSELASGRIAIGIDVGGSGIKAAVVDVEAGRFRSERLRVLTPIPATPEAVSASIVRLVRRLVRSGGLGPATPVGIGLPGVAINGVLKSAANIDPSWIDFPVVERLTLALKRPISIINDADAAGIAEMRFGVGVGQPGVVIFLTLGTGVGSGVFNDGVLVPNTEFGQMEIRGRAAERRSAAAARVRRGLSWKAWAADLDEHLDRIQQLMWPNLMILGGGVSKSPEKFIPRLTVKCPVVPAQLRNDAGIIGAAIIAAEAPVAKPAETKSLEALLGKSAETKPVETKTAETKTAETKPVETKTAETKTAETKPAETKSAETKSAETKSAEAKTAEASTTRPQAGATAKKPSA